MLKMLPYVAGVLLFLALTWRDAMAFTHELSRGQLIALYIINTLEVAVLIRLLLRRLEGRLLMGSVALYRFAIFSIVCYAVVLLMLTMRALLLQL